MEHAAQHKLGNPLMLDPATQIAFNTKKGSVPARTDLDVSSMDACAQKGVALLKDPKKAAALHHLSHLAG